MKYYKANDVKEVIKKLIKEPQYQHEGESFYDGVCTVAGKIACLHATTHKEPIVGEWKFTEPDKHRNRKPYCSNCGEYHLGSWSDYTSCNFCPTCGAKMNLVAPVTLVAQWKTREARNDYLWVECSNCGFLVENYKAVKTGKSSTDIVDYKWHACPKCTAKMIKEWS